MLRFFKLCRPEEQKILKLPLFGVPPCGSNWNYTNRIRGWFILNSAAFPILQLFHAVNSRL